MCVWASLSGKVCETSLMKNMRPSLLLRTIGIDASISCDRSDMRQFLSFVFKQCNLYSCETEDTRSTIFAFARSSIRVPVMFSGRSKYPSSKLNGSDVPSVDWKFVIYWFHLMVGFSTSVRRWCSNAGQFSGVPLKRVSDGLVIAVK
jgi:hypothetical protein